MNRKVLYSKIDYNRLEEFQIQTLIFSEKSHKRVVKKCLTDSSNRHLVSIIKKQKYWNIKYKSILMAVEGELINKNEVIFPFIEKANLESEILDDLFHGKYENADRTVRETLDILTALSEKLKRKIRVSSVYTGVRNINAGVRVLRVSNYDLSPSNLFRVEGGFNVFDLEWVENIPVELEFTIFNYLYILASHITPIYTKIAQHYQLIEITPNRFIPKIWVNNYIIFTKQKTLRYIKRIERLQEHVTGKKYAALPNDKLENKETTVITGDSQTPNCPQTTVSVVYDVEQDSTNEIIQKLQLQIEDAKLENIKLADELASLKENLNQIKYSQYFKLYPLYLKVKSIVKSITNKYDK